MIKKYLPFIVIALVIGIAVLAWKLPSKSTYTSSPSVESTALTSPEVSTTAASVNPTAKPQPAQTTPRPAITQSAPGQYISYSSEIIAKTPGTKVLFFHAPWCPQCRALETSIQAGPIPSGVSIIKVDYDTNQALRQKYGVTIQTTLVRVDDSGNLLKKYSAYDTPSLESLKANVL